MKHQNTQQEFFASSTYRLILFDHLGGGGAGRLAALSVLPILPLLPLPSAAETKDEMEGGLLLDVVVGESASVRELLAGVDESLLVRRDSLLVLNLGLDVLDGVGGSGGDGDGLAGVSLDEDLRLDVVVVELGPVDVPSGGFFEGLQLRGFLLLLHLLSSRDALVVHGGTDDADVFGSQGEATSGGRDDVDGVLLRRR